MALNPAVVACLRLASARSHNGGGGAERERERKRETHGRIHRDWRQARPHPMEILVERGTDGCS